MWERAQREGWAPPSGACGLPLGGILTPRFLTAPPPPPPHHPIYLRAQSGGVDVPSVWVGGPLAGVRLRRSGQSYRELFLGALTCEDVCYRPCGRKKVSARLRRSTPRRGLILVKTFFLRASARRSIFSLRSPAKPLRASRYSERFVAFLVAVGLRTGLCGPVQARGSSRLAGPRGPASGR